MKTKLLAFFGIGVGNFFFSFLFLFPLGLFAGEYSFTYKFEEPVAKELANGLYLIELKDTKQNDAVIGAPLLPVKQAKIFIPAEDKVTAVKVEPLELTAMEGAYTIQHATTPYPTSYQGVIVADKPDHKIYSSDSNYPAVSYQERGSQYLHGEQIVQVDISPVVYNPAQRQVDYYKQITVTVQTKDQGRPAGVLPARNLSTDIKAILTSIDNKEDYLSQHSASTEKKSTDITASSGNAKAAKPLVTRDYVVITTSAMTSAFTALANHRQSAAGGSFTTYIKDIANIRTSYTGVDDAEKIRKFIIDMYINYGTQFIVLGGDCDGAHGSQAISTRGTYAAVGSYTENYIPSDLYYGCLDGTWNNNGNTLWGESDDGVGGGDIDWASEVYVGRIPADTSTEATTQINKIIAYETGTHPNNTLLIGEKLDSTPTWGGDKVDWVYGFMNSMPKTELYDRDHGTNDWPRADLLSQINSNAHNWLNHLGHGNPYWNMKLANADVASMTNNKYFFHYTQACTSGSIDGRWPNGSYGADSILEDLVNSNNYGAFATIGNSRYGWYNSGTYVQGASNLVHKEFVEAIFSDGDTTLGEANQKSKTQLDLSQGIYRWIAFETNLLGDPVTEVTKGGSGDGDQVLWNQPISTSNTNAYANQDFETAYDGNDIWNGDDFTNTVSWNISTIYVPGDTWNPGSDLTCATSLNFYIYTDNSGVPAGYPDGGLGGSGAPVWSLSLAPANSQIALTAGVNAYKTNVTLNLTSPIQLPPGTYWLVYYPEMDYGTCG